MSNTTAGAPRLRIAPSPTGLFHVGNARSALFNWLYVRQNGGTFVLRIEDTDAERNREEWVDGILDTLRWLGLDWDEGPNRQSANKPAHLAAGQKLIDAGVAYYCDCERSDIDARNAAADRRPGYDNHCRDRGLTSGVLRFRVPSGKTTVHDLIRGDVEFDNETIEDFVVVRSNGEPMFVVANAIDDITERITHVVRGEEHLPNTPKQLMLWSVLAPELPVPTYAHLPVIVNEKRQKLSKRRDKVAVEMYREEGYLPEALVNYLALLGWAPKGDREIVSLETLVAEFRFEDVQKSSAFFDIDKLRHFNGEYIRALSPAEFAKRAEPFLAAVGYDVVRFGPLAELVQTRVATLAEIVPMVRFVYEAEIEIEDKALAVLAKPEMAAVLRSFAEKLDAVEWNTEELHALAASVADDAGLKLGKAQAPIRAAVTGSKVGLPLFESLAILGREVTTQRIDAALKEHCGST